METQELHRGRLIDHIQLVVRELAASKQFYLAVFAELGIPLGGKRRTTSGPTSSSFPRSRVRPRRARSPAAFISRSRARIAPQ